MDSVANKVEANNNSDRAFKKSGKEDKARRKDDKSVDQVMKALNNMETAEEKLSAMCKKYADVVDENRKLQLAAKQWEKGVSSLQREKEQIQADHSKAILTRSRLESLCRELQRQNKAVKEESLLKVREEEEKRKEVSAKFNATLAEITSLMSSSNEKTNKLRDENVDITKKFRSICEQSGLQQQQVDKMNMQRKLEAELSEAKMTKQKLEFSAEKEILLRDKQQLLMDLQEARTRASDLMANEMNLKTQVALYADRYEEFQNALSRSNEVFGGFKGEMDKMSKKIVKLEKETLSWKSRWEKSHQALLEMATDKQQRDAELALVTRQLAQLQKLCRTLQTERVGLLAQLRGDPLPEIKPEEVTTLPTEAPEEANSPLIVTDLKTTKAAQLKSTKKAKLAAEYKLKEALKNSALAAVGSIENEENCITSLPSEQTNGDVVACINAAAVTETAHGEGEPAAIATMQDLNEAAPCKNRNESELRHKTPQKGPSLLSEQLTSTAGVIAEAEAPQENISTVVITSTKEVPEVLVPVGPALADPTLADPAPVDPAPVLALPEEAPSPALSKELPSLALPEEASCPALTSEAPTLAPESHQDKVVPTDVKKGKEGAKKRKK